MSVGTGKAVSGKSGSGNWDASWVMTATEAGVVSERTLMKNAPMPIDKMQPRHRQMARMTRTMINHAGLRLDGGVEILGGSVFCGRVNTGVGSGLGFTGSGVNSGMSSIFMVELTGSSVGASVESSTGAPH
jgi:hypothetical protein